MQLEYLPTWMGQMCGRFEVNIPYVEHVCKDPGSLLTSIMENNIEGQLVCFWGLW